MTVTNPESRVALLRRRAVESLENTKFPIEAEQLLERLASVALEGSDDALFAHHELATLQLERSPWNAALHLRKVIAGRPNDHSAHALMGLCQALLANFRMAVTSYERAIALAPDVAGYHHNVGHFLDVAMGVSERAITYLERAHRLAPSNHEITASYAHGLARAGRLAEAETLAEEAAGRAPDEASHRNLLEWIRAGAPASAPSPLEQSPPPSPLPLPDVTRTRSEDTRPSAWSEVLSRLQTRAQDVDAALSLAASFADADSTWTNPPAMAGAIDYLSGNGESQRSVAVRHGVSVGALARRVASVRGVVSAETR
ncbi:MAG: tetratricopeptide repeat protein [Polyangiales bacterium]